MMKLNLFYITSRAKFETWYILMHVDEHFTMHFSPQTLQHYIRGEIVNCFFIQ